MWSPETQTAVEEVAKEIAELAVQKGLTETQWAGLLSTPDSVLSSIFSEEQKEGAL